MILGVLIKTASVVWRILTTVVVASLQFLAKALQKAICKV